MQLRERGMELLQKNNERKRKREIEGKKEFVCELRESNE